MNQPPKLISIDVGACPGWTLQKAEATTTTFIRCVSDDEAMEIFEAASFCRMYATKPTYRLLTSSYRVWQQTFTRAAEAKKEEWTPDLAEDLLSAFVGWLLVWRLILDQAEHDLSARFGADSVELTSFRAARRAAYDGSQSYRIVEALRNIVQHREMLPVILNRIKELDHASGLPVSKVSYKFPVSYLLASPKCPATIRAEFATTPSAEFELPAVIDGAMAAITPVLTALVQISTPELTKHILYLRKLFSETAPVPPLLLRVPRPAAGSKILSFNVEMQPLLDLAYLVQHAPIPQTGA